MCVCVCVRVRGRESDIFESFDSLPVFINEHFVCELHFGLCPLAATATATQLQSRAAQRSSSSDASSVCSGIFFFFFGVCLCATKANQISYTVLKRVASGHSTAGCGET